MVALVVSSDFELRIHAEEITEYCIFLRLKVYLYNEQNKQENLDTDN